MLIRQRSRRFVIHVFSGMHVRSSNLELKHLSQSDEAEMVRPTNMARVDMMVTNMKAAIEQEKKIEQFPLSLNMVHISSANNYIVMSCCNGPVLQTLLEDVDSVMEYIKLTDELEMFVASIRSSNSTPATRVALEARRIEVEARLRQCSFFSK